MLYFAGNLRQWWCLVHAIFYKIEGDDGFDFDVMYVCSKELDGIELQKN